MYSEKLLTPTQKCSIVDYRLKKVFSLGTGSRHKAFAVTGTSAFIRTAVIPNKVVPQPRTSVPWWFIGTTRR